MKLLINSIDGETYGIDVTPDTTPRSIEGRCLFRVSFTLFSLWSTARLASRPTRIRWLTELRFWTLTAATWSNWLSKTWPLWTATLAWSEVCFQRASNLWHLSGKVHGSLARSGKVRAQTPKVDKQEKKKKKRGKQFYPNICLIYAFRTCLPPQPGMHIFTLSANEPFVGG